MKRSDYMLAALASAVLPNLGVAGVRENVQASATDEAKGIDQTVIQDASGKLYDVYATDTKEGRTRLIRRVKAAQTLAAAREPGGLGFDMDRVVAFAPGDVSRPGQTATAQAVGQQTQAESTPLTPRKPGPTGETTVMIAVHRDGQARPLDLLTLDDCAAVGTAIGAIHRLPSTFLANAKYPVVTTGQIRSQLTAWIRRLRSAGHVPPRNHRQLGAHHGHRGIVVVLHLHGSRRIFRRRLPVLRFHHHHGDQLAGYAGQRSGTRPCV